MNDTTTRQHDTAATTDDDDSPALYTLAGLGTAAAAAWGWWQSGSLVAGLAAYGLMNPPGRPTPLGVFVFAVAVFGVVAAAQAISAGFGWARHRRAGGTTAVPPIPVAAGALALATAIAGAAFVAFGRDGGQGWVPVALAAFALAWAAARWGRAPARRFRAVAAFAARADQVLGHGALDIGRDQHGRRQRRRVRIAVTGWGRDGDGIEYPPRIAADVGVGYQHKPGELGELSRYARAFGWPAYTWAHDPITKTITGTAAGGVG